MTKLVVEVYGKKKCCLCKEVRQVVDRVNADIPFHFKDIDVDSSEELLRRYGDEVPTIFINGKKAFKYKLDEAEFRKRVRKEFIKAGMSRVKREFAS